MCYWTQSKWQVLGIEFEVDVEGGLFVGSWDFMLRCIEMLPVWNHRLQQHGSSKKQEFLLLYRRFSRPAVRLIQPPALPLILA